MLKKKKKKKTFVKKKKKTFVKKKKKKKVKLKGVDKQKGAKDMSLHGVRILMQEHRTFSSSWGNMDFYIYIYIYIYTD